MQSNALFIVIHEAPCERKGTTGGVARNLETRCNSTQTEHNTKIPGSSHAAVLFTLSNEVLLVMSLSHIVY